MLQAPWPNYSAEEAEIAQRVLLSNKVNYWTGSEARHFEEEFAGTFGSGYAIALANGTVAMDLALKALGIGAGDEVVVTSRSFIASASTVVNSGARPVFADVDAASQNITAETIDAVLTARTRAIICVHLAGWPCEMESICALASERGLAIIEDCAQAHGATYRQASVGTYGTVGSWSFCQDKIMTTAGEGGMVTTDDEDLYRLMWSFKDHGKSLEKVREPSTSTVFRWIHDSIGTNWRITEIQAAIGRFQLGQLRQWSEQRHHNAAVLNECLADQPGLRITLPPAHVKHAYYKYYFFIETERLANGWSRDRIVAEIVKGGVPCFTGTCPEIYREKAFTDLYGEPVRHPVAQTLGESSVMLNVHPGLTTEYQQNAAGLVTDVIKKALR